MHSSRDKERRSQLLAACSAGPLLKSLYELALTEDANLSLRQLALAAGIASKGYLSEVLSGKKLLHPRYAAALGRSVGLSKLEAKYFSLLTERDRCKDNKKSVKLQGEVEKTKKALTFSVGEIPLEFDKHPLLFDVFCAFGLFNDMPELEDLFHYFGRKRRKLVEQALDALVFHGLVRDMGFYFKIAGDANLFFQGGSFKNASIKIIKAMLQDSLKMIETWYPDRSMSLFESHVISTTSEKYQEVVNKMRETLTVTKAELETSDANLLVRLNVQIYPSHTPIKE